MVLAILIVVAVVAIKIFVNANTFRPTIEKQLATAPHGRDVKVGDLKLSVHSGSLVAEGLSVADDPSFSTEPFLTAKEFRIGVSMQTLIFSHKLDLRSFEIEAPQITLIRRRERHLEFFQPRTRPRTRRSPLPAPVQILPPGICRSSLPSMPDISVGSVAILDARAVIVGLPAHAKPVVYEHVNISAHDFSFSSKFPIDLAASLPSGGTVAVTGHIGPTNRDDPGASPIDLQISTTGFDPVAAGLLDPAAGISPPC